MSAEMFSCEPAESFSIESTEEASASGLFDNIALLKQILAFFAGLGLTVDELKTIFAQVRVFFAEPSVDGFLGLVSTILEAVGDPAAPAALAGGAGSKLAVAIKLIKLLLKLWQSHQGDAPEAGPLPAPAALLAMLDNDWLYKGQSSDAQKLALLERRLKTLQAQALRTNRQILLVTAQIDALKAAMPPAA